MNTAVIQGIVYSRLDSTMLEHTNIIIDKKLRIGATTDENGYFKKVVEPGLYSIRCNHIGHSDLNTKKLQVRKGDRNFLIFELGADLIY